MTPLDANTVKPEAVNQICRAKGWSYNPYAPASLKQFSDRMLEEDAASAALPRRLFGREELIAEGLTLPLRPPTTFNGFPKVFGSPPGPSTISAPPYTVLHVDDGTLGLVNDAPTVFDAEGYIHPAYSSFYYPILPHMGDGRRLRLDEARVIDGRAIVMMDDVGDINYCHWLCDWLPRLAALPAVTDDTYVVVLGCKASWQLETLRACGFPPSRIVSLPNWGAVRARELIVPSHMSDVVHPSYKGARWALDFLGRMFDTADEDAEGSPQRVYLSRADASGRRIANEAAFARTLESLGYRSFVTGTMSVAAQARLFRHARSIVALHGAGLTNLVFCRPDTKVLEIMPENYGTPAFWILANGCQLDYGSYLAKSLSNGSISQTEDVEIDIEHFRSAAREWLLPSHQLAATGDCKMPKVLMTAHRTLLYWNKDGQLTHSLYGQHPDEDLVEIDDERSLINPREGVVLQYLPTYYGRYAFVMGDRNYSAEPSGNDSTRPLSANPGPWEAFIPISLDDMRRSPPLEQPTPDGEIARFKAKVEALTAEGKPVKVHVGCAHTLLPGFLNIDIVDGEPSASVSRPDEYFVFPFADRSWEIDDGTVDYIFSEDFIEHISQLQQIQFLTEALRVLKPGAVNRVSTPNLITSMTHHSDFSKGHGGVYTGERNLDHISIFSPASLAEIASMVGYSEADMTAKDASRSSHKAKETRPGADRYWADSNIHADLVK